MSQECNAERQGTECGLTSFINHKDRNDRRKNDLQKWGREVNDRKEWVGKGKEQCDVRERRKNLMGRVKSL